MSVQSVLWIEVVASKQVSAILWLHVLRRGHCPLKRGGCFSKEVIPLEHVLWREVVSKLNRSLNWSNYQILLWPFSADNFCAYYNPGYTISISFSCGSFVALLMWFNVVVTNIINHYHFIYNLSWNENIKKTRRCQLIYFISINLHTIINILQNFKQIQ